MTESAQPSKSIYTKVCAGLLNEFAHPTAADPKQSELAVPGVSGAAVRRPCTYVWLQARCTSVTAATPSRRVATATLDDGSGCVLAVCEENDSMFVPGRYLMVLGRAQKRHDFNNAWVISPHKTVDLSGCAEQRRDLWKLELLQTYATP